MRDQFFLDAAQVAEFAGIVRDCRFDLKEVRPLEVRPLEAHPSEVHRHHRDLNHHDRFRHDLYLHVHHRDYLGGC